MRVLHVIDVLNVGGAERVFIDITTLLAGKGVCVDVLLFDDRGALTSQLPKEVKIYNLDRKKKYAPGKLLKAHQICNKYDIVHVHMRHCYAYIRLAQLLFGGKYKLILHDHNGMNKDVTFGLKYSFRPPYYIGVSQDLCNWSVDILGVDRTRSFLLGNTIIPGDISYEHNSVDSTFVISNIRRVKNIEFAIDIFKNSSSKLVIYGNIIDEDYYKELLKLIGDANNICIVSGVTDFSSKYNMYDLALHCSKAESGPLVLLEYMAHGIPFIAYRTGDVAEKLYRELPMYFMESFDKNEWIERIKEIKAFKGHKEILQEAFEKYFSPSSYVQECLRIYQSVNS